MLVKVTNDCAMGCSHCMESSLPAKGTHMSMPLFHKTLDFIRRIEILARTRIGYNMVLLSGGEPTDNPDLPQMIEETYKAGFAPTIITHGLWLGDTEKVAQILRPEWPDLQVQVTSDLRFYPTDIRTLKVTEAVLTDPRLRFVETLTRMLPLGRYKSGRQTDVADRTLPTSFNVRAITWQTRDIRDTIYTLRKNVMSGGLSGHCAPSITHEGDLVAGESRACWKIGTVESSSSEVTDNVLAMGECNRCGLEGKLDNEKRKMLMLRPVPVSE